MPASARQMYNKSPSVHCKSLLLEQLMNIAEDVTITVIINTYFVEWGGSKANQPCFDSHTNAIVSLVTYHRRYDCLEIEWYTPL